MKTQHLLASVVSLGLLVGCSNAPEDASEGPTEAEEFAARINANKPKPSAQPGVAAPPGDAAPVLAEAPTIAPPAPSAAPGAYVPGTATDPSSQCNAGMFASFIGQPPSAKVREQIMQRAVDLPEVRFIAPGADYIRPDSTNPRLNVMIAVDGIIRDVRCG